MSEINLGQLAHAPHATLIRDMANKCATDSSIQAIWVGGSLAAGHGDAYSDVDFRIAVEPGHVDGWTSPALPANPIRQPPAQPARQIVHHVWEGCF